MKKTATSLSIQSQISPPDTLPAQYASYPIMGEWKHRIDYILGRQKRGLTIREIANYILSFEPSLTKEKSLKQIIGMVGGTICRRKVSYYVDKSEGNKRTKYSLHAHYKSSPKIPSVYPLKGTIPKKIEFILKREARKLTNDEIVENIIEHEPELRNTKMAFSSKVFRALKIRQELFCKETSPFVKSPLYYLKENSDTINEIISPLHYPQRGNWLQRIIFIMEQENRKVTQRQIAQLLLPFEPDMANRLNSLYTIISYTLKKNPEIFTSDKTNQLNKRYWLTKRDKSENKT